MKRTKFSFVRIVASIGISAFVGLSSCGGVIHGDETCGAGTVDVNGTCRSSNVDASTVFCGTGTVLDGDECRPSDGSNSDGSSFGGEGGTMGQEADAGTGADAGIDVATACLTSDNIFVIAGNDWVHSGPPLTIQGGVGWSVNIEHTVDGLPSYVDINVGLNWEAAFSTNSLGTGLLPGTYTNAQRAPFTDPNHPGIDVTGEGAGCDTQAGQFTVVEMTANADASIPNLQSITVTFEQHCEGGTNYNVGCVHFTQP